LNPGGIERIGDIPAKSPPPGEEKNVEGGREVFTTQGVL
jgi:hypothetical protein